MSLWLSSTHCPVFPCQRRNNKASNGNEDDEASDLLTVVSESMLLFLEPDTKLKNVSKMTGWFSLTAIQEIKRNLDNPDSISFRFAGDDTEFSLIMQNANECVNMIVKQIKRGGLSVHKKYEKKKKSSEEVEREQHANHFTHNASLS